MNSGPIDITAGPDETLVYRKHKIGKISPKTGKVTELIPFCKYWDNGIIAGLMATFGSQNNQGI